jgi:hypothetical protein
MKTRARASEAGENDGCMIMVWIVAGGLALSVVITMCESPSDKPRKPSAFESGARKIDSGHPEEVTKEEAQALDRALNNK